MTTRLRVALLGFLVTGIPGTAAAQYVEPPAPVAYALPNVTVITPEEQRDGVTLVVREGLIEAIGPDVAIPADARVLSGDSLRVYPGFVDADGELAWEFPDPEVDRSRLESWDPPREAQGFTPERRVVDVLEATGEDVSDPRSDGVVAMGLLPDGPAMPGRGAVVFLRPDAEAPRELVAVPELGPVLTFEDPSGAYPSTTFGLMAFYRQKFEDARRHRQLAQARSQDPLRVPALWDPSLEVLREALQGDVRVFFRADEEREIRRVLTLADEYGFRPVIVGGEEAWKLAAELRGRGVPVLVSLDFPEPERWEPDEEEEDPAESPEPPLGEAEPERVDVEERREGEAQREQEEVPLDPDAVREKRRIEAARANPGRLAEAGIVFALTSGGGEADLREGARMAVEYGLVEEEALRALTATPADLLGVPEAAGVRVGGPATFLVADGPLFGEDTRLRWSFVEGHAQALVEDDGAAVADEPPAVDLSGTWDIRVETEGGDTFTGTLELEQSGEGELEGAFDLGTVTGRLTSGSISGTSIRMTGQFRTGGEALTADFEGTVEEDRMSGDGSSPEGRFEWSAERAGPGGTL